MARAAARLPENADGPLYVDSTCIDCDTCRELAPDTFARSSRGLSYVATQPPIGPQRMRALQALVSCPVAAIGLPDSHEDIRRAAQTLPVQITDHIYTCGYASKSSYGAQSYLIRRAGGNVLVDSPRAAKPLLERLDDLGGVAFMFLTHRDDVADHAVFSRRYGCQRILHRADVSAETRDVERLLEGDSATALAEDLLAIPVPGHTRGSAALLYREETLFSGDHLWWDADEGGLWASRSVCWWSWPEQRRSLRKLLSYRFQRVLPGHGGRHDAGSPDAMRSALTHLVTRLA